MALRKRVELKRTIKELKHSRCIGAPYDAQGLRKATRELERRYGADRKRK
jgi:hypothetical protein